MVDSNDQDDGRIQQLFRAVDEGLSASDPLLKEHILAHLEEAGTRAKLRRCRRWAIQSLLAGALLLVAVFAQRPAAFEARVDTAALIRVEVEELPVSGITYVKVDLADREKT